MKLISRFVCLITMLALAACGGGGGSAGEPAFGSGAGGGTGGGTGGGVVVKVPEAADVVLVLSSRTVANTGAESVVATATAIDANRSTVTGVPVTIAVNNNGVATPRGSVTNASGQLEALIGIGADRTPRTLTVTATANGKSQTATLVVQDTGSGAGSASDLLLTLSAETIGNDGTRVVTATATALDAKRNVLPGVLVSISVDSGATALPSGTTTNARGVVTADIGVGVNRTLRAITVTATATGLPPSRATLQVVSLPTITPVAADLSLTLSSNSVVNSGTSTVRATVTAVDANRNALSGIPVTITVDSNAVATISGRSTDVSGVVTANVGIGADRSNRSITVTASSGGVTRSASFRVTGATLNVTASPRVTVSSTGNQIEYRLLDDSGAPMPNLDITVTAVGLPSGSGKTDSNGRFIYTYVAPSTPTTLSVVASSAGVSETRDVLVQSAGSSIPGAALPQSASLTPTPSVVSVNAVGSTNNQVELRALFLGLNNQPVPNVRVLFSLDPINSSDGRVSQPAGSTFAYSDATGVARGTFTPGQRSSPTNGVTVRACWGQTDTEIDPNARCPEIRLITSTLTIASEALSVNIRTNNLIKTGTAGLTYIKEFVVMVVDAAGQAKADVLITPSVDLTAYYKGVYIFDGKQWAQNLYLAATENYRWDSLAGNGAGAWVRGGTTGQPFCPNEDVNRNGVREAGTSVPGASAPDINLRQEDLNWNGEIDPRKSDVAIKMVGSNRTDANGLAIVQIEYGQSVASWVDYIITVTASGVAGTESRARFAGSLYGIGNLPFPAAAVTDETIPPAFVVSPYGRGGLSALPNGVAVPIGVCTDSR